jgi:hypothetical protein
MKLDIHLQRYLNDVKTLTKMFGMVVLDPPPSDQTLYYVSGGKTFIQFSIKPVKMVSVWQINEGIVSQLKQDLIPYQLRAVNLALNRRVTIDLMRYGLEEKELIRDILSFNKI